MSMNKEELIQLFNKEQRIEIEFPGSRREASEKVIRQISFTEEDGFISYSDFDEETIEAAILEQLEYFNQVGQRFEWKVYDYDRPSDLIERLRKHRFEIGEREALLVMQLNEENPLLNYVLPTNLQQITDEVGVDDIISLEDEIWGYSHADLGTRLKRDLKDDPENLRIYAFYENGKVTSAAWMYLHEGTSFGSLWGGSTLPEARKKGYYTALIAVRAQVAWKKGYKCLTVDASPMSRPILEKKGFEFLGYSYPCKSPKE